MPNCRKCDVVLTVGVNWYSSAQKYHNYICRACARVYEKANFEGRLKSRLKFQYKLSLEDYKALLQNQDNKCAICNCSSPTGRWDSFHVDHCHTTGKVRGLLCHHCNTGIGNLKDSIEILNKAISYLENKKYG